MNVGAQHASGEWLWFLHADCWVHSDSLKAIAALSAAAGWGCFCHRIDAPNPLLRIIETADNLRASRLHLPYGDQGIFVRRSLFEEMGGYEDVPLLEDLILARRLVTRMAPIVLSETLVCDARRWLRGGIRNTTILNWKILWNYFVLRRTPAELATLWRQ
jgi:glycosyltransferase involved in cell wall biosynthesis